MVQNDAFLDIVVLDELHHLLFAQQLFLVCRKAVSHTWKLKSSHFHVYHAELHDSDSTF